jgi:hypothetical protein
MNILNLLMLGLVYAFGALVVVSIEGYILILFGAMAAKCPVPARIILWPIGLALLIAFLPGFFWVALLFGFMTPTFDGHLKPRARQGWRRRGLNDLLELLSAPWKLPEPLPAKGDNPVQAGT